MPYKDNFDDVAKHLWEHEADRPMQWPFEVIGPLERGEVDILFITSGAYPLSSAPRLAPRRSFCELV